MLPCVEAYIAVNRRLLHANDQDMLFASANPFHYLHILNSPTGTIGEHCWRRLLSTEMASRGHLRSRASATLARSAA